MKSLRTHSKMAKNTVFIVLVAILVIHGLISTSSNTFANGLPMPGGADGGAELMDLETSANTIIFRPMFVYRLQQRRIQQKLQQLKKIRAQKASANQLR